MECVDGMCQICRDECTQLLGVYLASYRSVHCTDPNPADVILAPLPQPQAQPRPRERFNSAKFGHKLHSIRSAKGLLQTELAIRTNIGLRTLQAIEAGRSIPRIDTVAALADALNIALDELMPLTAQPETS